MANLLTAEQARKSLESTNKANLEKALQVVDASIKESISAGKSYCYVYPQNSISSHLLKSIFSSLEDLGYLVQYTNTQRDGEYFIINW